MENRQIKPIHRDRHNKNLFLDGETFTGPALDALLAGYEDVLPLNAAERAAFPPADPDLHRPLPGLPLENRKIKPLHRDPHSKNLLFDGEIFTGPALDALLAGYEDVLPLSAAERAAFPPLTLTCTALYQAFLWKTGK